MPRVDWHLQSLESDGVQGISAENSFDELLRDRPSKEVIVAVLDSGIDLDHEDLKDNIWVNLDEIPDNGIDDDANGYIDDVHGWNFVGGPDGVNVNYETLEITRIYAKLKAKYENTNVQHDVDSEEYQLFLHAKSEVTTHLKKNKDRLVAIESEESLLRRALEAIRNKSDSDTIVMDQVRTITIKPSDSLTFYGRNLLENLNDQDIELSTFSLLDSLIVSDYSFRKEKFIKNVFYAFNTDYDSRATVVKDNYNDSTERYYGNNDAEGPNPFHGTHVAGIIGAVKDNQLGIRGVASNVKIMSVRCVPDGDERDKDIANSIRYAVDNGASVINMSFGKYYSWDKSIVDQAVQYAEAHDVVLVHSAGNNSRDLDTIIHFPSKMYERKFLRPKKAKNFIEVGASDWKSGRDLVAEFSNFGNKSVDVFAPGSLIYSTIPDDGYGWAGGTSMAAPVVSGLIAVVRSYYPDLTAKKIKKLLMKTCRKYSHPVQQPGQKYVIPFDQLSRSDGVVDLFNLIDKLEK